MSEDDTFGVETCRSLIMFYIFIIVVLSLVELQMKNKQWTEFGKKITSKENVFPLQLLRFVRSRIGYFCFTF